MPGHLKQVAWILAFLVGMPGAGLLVARAGRWKAEATFRDQMERVVPASERARTQTRPLAELCAMPGAETDAACDPYAPATLLGTGAAAVGVAGLLFVALILGAGMAARADRALALRLFAPGLTLTVVVTIGLTVAHAVLAAGAALVLAAVTTGRLPLMLIGPFVGGAVFGLIALTRSLPRTVERARAHVVGEEVSREAAPALWQLVDAVAAKITSLGPERIVAGLGVDFFVTEAEVATPAAVFTGRTLFVSLPLARLLTVEELAAIVGHELGHFRGADTAYSQSFYPIYRGTTEALGSLYRSARGGQLIALLPAFALLGVFLDAFRRAERRDSRNRELRADAAGVEATSARVFAATLVKMHAFAPAWGAVAMWAYTDALNARQPNPAPAATPDRRAPYNLSLLFQNVVRPSATADRLRNLGQALTSHPTDTHPPLVARLDALGLAVADVAGDALRVAPDIPAFSLFADGTALEERLSAGLLAAILRPPA